MYLRETKRKNGDGSIARYYQLAENEWDKTKAVRSRRWSTTSDALMASTARS